LEQITEGAINIALGPGASPGAVPQAITSSGWRMTSQDGEKAIVLLPSSVAFEAFTYGGWDDDFAPQLATLVEAVAEVVQPVFEQRLGLRYINQVTSPEVLNAEGVTRTLAWVAMMTSAHFLFTLDSNLSSNPKKVFD
jgi:uncharacterized protein (TIGR04255 family)